MVSSGITEQRVRRTELQPKSRVASAGSAPVRRGGYASCLHGCGYVKNLAKGGRPVREISYRSRHAQARRRATPGLSLPAVSRATVKDAAPSPKGRGLTVFAGARREAGSRRTPAAIRLPSSSATYRDLAPGQSASPYRWVISFPPESITAIPRGSVRRPQVHAEVCGSAEHLVAATTRRRQVTALAAERVMLPCKAQRESGRG